MRYAITSLVVSVFIIVIMACSVVETSGCSCASIAIEVTAIEANGYQIPLDSIKFIMDNGEIQTIKKKSGEDIDCIVGSEPGQYKVWSYYRGVISDTIIADIVMAGPENCRRPSTQKISFSFTEDDYKGNTLEKIRSCGE